jgi:Tol biopolymer transport system component
VDPARRFTSIGDMGTALHDALAPPRVRAPVRVLALLLLVMTATGVFYVRANHPGHRRGGADAGVRVARLPAANLGWPSADGRLYPYVDASNNALMLWDVQPGSSRTILRFDGTGESVSAPLMSPAGDRVSYAVTSRTGLHELRISNVDGTWQRVLIAAQRAFEPIPTDWSRDGSVILCWLREGSGKGDLVTVSTTGGVPRLLYSMALEWPAHARLSPDGRFIAISAPRQSNPRSDELLIVPSDGSGPYPLLDDTANDTVPLWTADGSRLIFVRDSSAVEFSRDAWVVPVRNGRKAGEPRMAISNVGMVQLRAALSTTDGGELNSIIDDDSREVYVGPIDLSGATVAGPAAPIVSNVLGEHVGPSWSPDGATIAYFTTTGSPAPGGVPLKTLSFLDVASGAVRQPHPHLVFLGGYAPQWSPDSVSVVVWGKDAEDNDRFGYYRVDVHTGQTQSIKITGNRGAPAASQCAPDGHRFLYDDHTRGIVSLDLRTGLEDVIVPQLTNVEFRRFALSPDGRSIAVMTHSAGTPNRGRVIEIWTGNQRRELVRARDGELFDLEAWTPDGKAVLFLEGAIDQSDVWRIDTAGGEPRPLHLRINVEVNPLSLSPDGLRVAYPERIRHVELRILPLR